MAVKKAEKPIAQVLHYFDKIGVAVLALEAPLAEGDEIRITGAATASTRANDHTSTTTVTNTGIQTSDKIIAAAVTAAGTKTDD